MNCCREQTQNVTDAENEEQAITCKLYNIELGLKMCKNYTATTDNIRKLFTKLQETIRGLDARPATA